MTSPIDYAGLPRDTKREDEMCAMLRTKNEHEKFEFVWRVMKINPGAGLRLAKRVQLIPVFLEIILEHGFVYGNASSVRMFYEATVDGLGERRVYQLVSAHLERAPLIVDKMLYWFRPNDEDLMQEVRALKARFNEMYPEFKSNHSTGILPTGC